MPQTDRPVDSIVHIADLHFWRVTANPLRLLNKRFLGNLNVWLRRRREFVMERSEAFADAVAATGITQVILTGDFTSTSLDEEFAMARDFVRGLLRRGLTPYVLPGNHDVYTFESVRRKRFERYFAEFLPPGGYPARFTLPGGTGLLLVPTVCPNLVSSKGRVPRAVIERSAALLAAGPANVIVAGHYPVLSRTHGYATDASRRLRNADALRTALGASGRRILYVCGHVHRFSLTQDPRFESLQHLSTDAFFRDDHRHGRQGSFSAIEVYHDRWRVIRRTYEAGWQQREETGRAFD